MFKSREDLVSSESDSELGFLETDIQRFTAILAFCLMCIFALVQSIPVTGDEAGKSLQDVSLKFERQAEELAAVKAENKRLLDKLKKVSAENRETSEKRKISELEKRLKAQQERIQTLLSEKKEKASDFDTYKRQLDKRERVISELKEELDKIRNRPIVKSEKAARRKKVSDPSVLPKQSEGLLVVFSSDAAFMKLLMNGTIKLFIKSENLDAGFQAIPKPDGGIGFKSGGETGGLDLWGVGEAMVPGIVISEFSRWTSLASGEKTYIVGLPSDMSRKIRNSKSKYGKYVIQENGGVSFSQ